VTERSHFFAGIPFSDADFAEVHKDFRGDGIVRGILDECVISLPGGMLLQFNRGRTFIQGFWYTCESGFSKTVANNTSGSTRYDLPVLRLDRVAKQITGEIHQGTPGAGTPALTRVAGGTWELGLGQLAVVNGASSFTAADLTDWRGLRSVCGFTGGVPWRRAYTYVATTDIANGVSMSANTFYGLGGVVHNFTVSEDDSETDIDLRLGAYLQNNSASPAVAAAWLFLDSVQSSLLQTVAIPAGGVGLLNGGRRTYTALAPGAHSLYCAVITNQTPVLLYVRASSSSTYENYNVEMTEWFKGN
jgi:hypothetical protein